ncbi:MAG: DUF5711 family protein [Sedimentibacter sp.]
MKKLITFIIIFMVIIIGIIFFTYGKEFLTLLDEKKVYNVEDIEKTRLDTLDEFKFFNDGIITYNNQKIIFLDYKNNIVWENEDGSFSKQVFVTDNNIFRDMEDTIQVLDKNNQKFVMSEIQGDIVNVSRENDKTYMIIKNGTGQNSLYILNSKNEVVVDNKVFDDNITGVSISDKSEGYSLITMRFENNSISNTVYFILIDDVELWNSEINDEILIKIQIVNNNVVVIGTDNVYYINTNGKLMWKNGIYNKILDYEINIVDQKIYILYKHDAVTELVSYNFEGKLTGLNEAPGDIQKLKVYDDKVFVYNKNSIYLIHGLKTDKIYEDAEGSIADFIAVGNDIHILSKNKLISGQIK